MNQLKQEFIDGCKIEDGFRLRGESMTRIEVFVDATFAFAVTMLVISIDRIPNSIDSLIEISKQIPAFIVSAIQLMWVWQTHSIWSKRFGLEDNKTVVMSTALVIIVLIFVYPLKMMFSGLFVWLSDGFFPSEFKLSGWDELRFLFSYFAVIFIAISLNFLWMYQHALNLADKLRLSEEEIFKTQTYIFIRGSMVVIGSIALITPHLVSDNWLPMTGFVYALIGIAYPTIEIRRDRIWKSKLTDQK